MLYQQGLIRIRGYVLLHLIDSSGGGGVPKVACFVSVCLVAFVSFLVSIARVPLDPTYNTP